MQLQVHVRLPDDLKAWLREEATRKGSSQNSEIIRAIRYRMEREAREQAKKEETA
jgi:hypothetical protein